MLLQRVQTKKDERKKSKYTSQTVLAMTATTYGQLTNKKPRSDTDDDNDDDAPLPLPSLYRQQTLVIQGMARDDIALGDILGRGSYAEVLEILSIKNSRLLHLTRTDSCNTTTSSSSSSSHSDSSCDSDTSSSRSLAPPVVRKLALKRLHQQAQADSKQKQRAMRDMAIEADILARIARTMNEDQGGACSCRCSTNNRGRQHIIKLHAVSHDFWKNPPQRFLVLDYITETLEQRLNYWRILYNVEGAGYTPSVKPSSEVQRDEAEVLLTWDYQKRLQASATSQSLMDTIATVLVHNRRRKQQCLVEQQRARIAKVGLGVSRGLAFLHEQCILFRDLKPSNVGFDGNDTIRIFDFGLARSVEPEGNEQNDVDDDECSPSSKLGRYCLTGVAGTYRYMAPEVFSNQEYSFPADVFSFSMLLYETITLRKPLSFICYPSQVQRLVVDAKMRPPLTHFACAPREMKQLLRQSWHHDPDERPTFASIVRTLEEVTSVAAPTAADRATHQLPRTLEPSAPQ